MEKELDYMDFSNFSQIGTLAESDPKKALQEVLFGLESLGSFVDAADGVDLPGVVVADLGKAIKILSGVGLGLSAAIENKQRANLKAM